MLAYVPAPSSETAASYVAALTDRSVKASRINWTTVPNGASIAVVGFLNLMDLMTSAATPTCNASGSCAAHSNALLHSRAIGKDAIGHAAKQADAGCYTENQTALHGSRHIKRRSGALSSVERPLIAGVLPRRLRRNQELCENVWPCDTRPGDVSLAYSDLPDFLEGF